MKMYSLLASYHVAPGVLAVEEDIPETISEGNEMQSEPSSTKSASLPLPPLASHINKTDASMMAVDAAPVAPTTSFGSVPSSSATVVATTKGVMGARIQRRDVQRLLELDDDFMGHSAYDTYGISAIPRVQLPVPDAQQVRGGQHEDASTQQPSKYMRTDNDSNDSNRRDGSGNGAEVITEKMNRLSV
jgi:hypothetical protein